MPNSCVKEGKSTLNRLLIALLCIAGTGWWLLAGQSVHSATPQTAFSVQYVEGDSYQKQRSFSPAVITQGGKTIWLAGQFATEDLNGKSLLGNFEGQARTVFSLMDRTLKRNGASLRNLVAMTVFINDPRYGDDFVKLRHEIFPSGNFPASTLITISNFGQPGRLIEIQGVAVIDK